MQTGYHPPIPTHCVPADSWYVSRLPRDIPGQKNIDKDNQAQQQPGILHPKREKQVENGCYAEFNPLFLGKLLHLFLLLIKI